MWQHRASSYIPITADWGWQNVSRPLLSAWHACGGPKPRYFSLTSGAAVMKMNTELGYVPVTFNELTDDEAFWKGCEGCINHETYW